MTTCHFRNCPGRPSGSTIRPDGIELLYCVAHEAIARNLPPLRSAGCCASEGCGRPRGQRSPLCKSCRPRYSAWGLDGNIPAQEAPMTEPTITPPTEPKESSGEGAPSELQIDRTTPNVRRWEGPALDDVGDVAALFATMALELPRSATLRVGLRGAKGFCFFRVGPDEIGAVVRQHFPDVGPVHAASVAVVEVAAPSPEAVADFLLAPKPAAEVTEADFEPPHPLETRRDALVERLKVAGFVEAGSALGVIRRFTGHGLSVHIPGSPPCEVEREFKALLDKAEEQCAKVEQATAPPAAVEDFLRDLESGDGEPSLGDVNDAYSGRWGQYTVGVDPATGKEHTATYVVELVRPSDHQTTAAPQEAADGGATPDDPCLWDEARWALCYSRDSGFAPALWFSVAKEEQEVYMRVVMERMAKSATPSPEAPKPAPADDAAMWRPLTAAEVEAALGTVMPLDVPAAPPATVEEFLRDLESGDGEPSVGDVDDAPLFVGGTDSAPVLPGRWGQKHTAPLDGLAALAARGQQPTAPGPTLADVQAELARERERAELHAVCLLMQRLGSYGPDAPAMLMRLLPVESRRALLEIEAADARRELARARANVVSPTTPEKLAEAAAKVAEVEARIAALDAGDVRG